MNRGPLHQETSPKMNGFATACISDKWQEPYGGKRNMEVGVSLSEHTKLNPFVVLFPDPFSHATAGAATLLATVPVGV